MQAEPGQLAVEPLAVGLGGEVAVRGAPVGDGAADAVDELADALLAFAGAHLAVEILVGHDVRGQLAPRGGNFAVLLLEKHLAAFAFDGGGPQIPFDRGERIACRHPGRTERAR